MLGGPEAKAVVVLGGQHGECHARGLRGSGPLGAVYGRGSEQQWVLVGRCPFLIGKVAEIEMDEHAEAHVDKGLLVLVCCQYGGGLGGLADAQRQPLLIKKAAL